MKRLTVMLSDSEIDRHCAELDVLQLRDPRYPLRLRYRQTRCDKTAYNRASWFYVYSKQNKSHWQKIGNWPELKTKAVVKLWVEIAANVAVNDENAVPSQQLNTVAELLNWYMGRCQKLKKMSPSRKASIKSMVQRHLIPKLGQYDCDQLIPSVIDDKLIIEMQSHYQLSTVRLSFVILKAAFNKAYGLKKITINPLNDINFSQFINDEIKPREGKLKKEQLTHLFLNLEHAPLRTQCLIILLLCCATRLNETRLITWSQIDFERAVWVIPACHTKNENEHEIPLSEIVITLLKYYKQVQINKGYRGVFLFPNTKRKTAISISSVSQWVRELSQGEYSAHDFRKLSRSIWNNLNIDYMVGERLLNHSLGKLDKAYLQNLIEAPKREAIERYHQYLSTQGLSVYVQEIAARSPILISMRKPKSHAA